jgi:DNA-binding response OmpR family regulator
MSMDQKKNILIVEDDPFMQSLYRKALEREGFTILTAVDGLIAVEMLPNICVDLIVLDLMLPKIPGLKVLETIRADSQNKNLPVLILSNAYLPEMAQKAMKSGATTGILKSECSPKLLVKIIRDILKLPVPENSNPPAVRNPWIPSFSGNKDAQPVQRESGVKAVEPAAVSEVQDELLKSWPAEITMIREFCLKYVKSAGSPDSEEHLRNLYRRLRLLSARATMGGCNKISQLSTGLEAMVFEHGFKLNKNMSPSVVQTMVQAVDGLEYLFKTGRTASIQTNRKARLLLVDDDAVCNRVNDIALKRANFDTVCACDGIEALALLEKDQFDLIFLDVNMPVLSGFEVCEKIRKLPQYKDTPIIFVTSLGDFQSRAKSVLSGSNGFIAKPITPLELIVKALVFLFRAQEKETATQLPSAHTPALDGKAGNFQTPIPLADSSRTDSRVKELQATQAAVEERVKTLTQALAADAKRREEVEQQAAANAKLQSKLETAQIEHQKARESLERMLEESKKQAQNSESSQASKTEGRTRALEAARNFVEEKIHALTVALAVETKKCEGTKQQVAEYAKRRSELEAALAAIQQAKENLMREIAAVGNGQLRGKLKAALEENQKTQACLLQKMEETRLEFQTQQQGGATEQSNIEARMKELEAAQAELAELKSQHANVTQQVQSLNASLAAESGRRTTAEQQAAELVVRRAELEQELTRRSQTQAQLLAELAAKQPQLDAQVQAHNAELGNLSERTKELEAAQAELAALKSQHASVTQQVESLSASLTAESGRRKSAEQQAAELLARRTELEQELARRTETQEKLRAELAAQQQRLGAQVQTHNAELGNLIERTKELEAAQAELAELKSQHASVTKQVESLSASLAAETGRRMTAEQQVAELLAQRTETQAQLRAELAAKQQQLDAQVQVHNAELGNLAERTKELEAAQAALAALKSQHASVSQQIESLSASLAAETGRRTTAEQQAAELVARRAELEQELARRTETQAQLQTELAAQQQRLNAVSSELDGFRSRASVEALSQEQMAEQIAKSEHARTELNNELNVVRELSFTREAAIRALEIELQQRRGKYERLDALLQGEVMHRRRLEAQLESVQSQLNEAFKELAQKAAAEQRLIGRESELQNCIRKQQDDIAKSGATLASQEAEIKQARTKIEELQMLQSALCTKVQGLTEQLQSLNASLIAESDRRATVEQQAAELVARRTELEQELAQRTQTQAQLRAELAAQQQRFEAQVQMHNLALGDLATRTKELEAAQAALAALQTQHVSVTKQVESLNESLTAASRQREAAEQVWHGLESELQGSIRNQQNEIAKSGATLALQAVEIKNARKKIEELQVLQSALCEKVQDLTAKGEATAKVVQELEEKAAHSENAVEDGQKQLAALRYAIMDASRMSARLHRERSQKERQNVDAMRQLLSSLAQTPLSLAQREMLAELQNSMDGIKSSRAGTTKIAAYPVEPLGLHESEFFFAEVSESAFHAVRAAAEAAGVAVQISATDTVTGKLIGNAEHVHQLITLLAASPLNMEAGVNALDLRAAIKPKSARLAEMTLRIAFSTDNHAQDLLARLTSVTAAASTLQTGSFSEAELGLAAGWQLALAMGVQPTIQADGGKETSLVLSLPMEMDEQPSPAASTVDNVPAANGNGRKGNGKHNSFHNGHRDDNHPNEPDAELRAKSSDS